MAISSSRGSCDTCSTGFDFFKKIIVALACVLIVYGIIYIDTLVSFKNREFSFIGKAPRSERTVTVNGFAKVSGKNDIAVTTIGYSNTDKDVATARANNVKVMDQVMAELKRMGIEEKDLTTQYSVYPDYDYTTNKIRGYTVSNSVNVKIRDLSKVETVLSLAGKYNANQVSGLSFTIDDPENLKNEAREAALLDAKAKAKKLAGDLGVRLVAVVNYSEYSSPSADYTPYYEGDMGGAVEKASSVSSGSQDVGMNVTVTYEIAP